ncbi:mCG1027888, partial [Mus musculus]
YRGWVQREGRPQPLTVTTSLAPNWSLLVLGLQDFTSKAPTPFNAYLPGVPSSLRTKSPLEGLSRAKTKPPGPAPFFCPPLCPGPKQKTGPRSEEDGGWGPDPGQRRDWGWTRMVKEEGSPGSNVWKNPPSSCPLPPPPPFSDILLLFLF